MDIALEEVGDGLELGLVHFTDVGLVELEVDVLEGGFGIALELVGPGHLGGGGGLAGGFGLGFGLGAGGFLVGPLLGIGVGGRGRRRHGGRLGRLSRSGGWLLARHSHPQGQNHGKGNEVSDESHV
jgi:hypothetical protein